MSELTFAERELVALGAALGSNCVPCIEYHIPEARKAGLDDGRITEAVRLADKVRQVPARKVLAKALELLQVAPVEPAAPETGAGCAQPGGQEQTTPCCA